MFQAIYELRNNYNVNLLCNICTVSESGYYKWLKNNKSNDDNDKVIISKIQIIQDKHKYRYGVERVTAALKRDFNINCNHKRVYRLMKKYGLLAKVRPKKRFYGTKENNPKSNILNRNFKTSSPFDKLATDISEVAKGGKKIYISIIKDLHTKVIEGLEISYSPTLKLVIDTINHVKDKAIKYGTFLHSDQGFQYNHPTVQKILKDNNFLQSMSRKGTPIDNSPTESFFGVLKSELIYNECVTISNDKEAIQEIINYVYYYNNERIQKGLGYLTPIEFKQKEMMNLK